MNGLGILFLGLCFGSLAMMSEAPTMWDELIDRITGRR